MGRTGIQGTVVGLKFTKIKALKNSFPRCSNFGLSLAPPQKKESGFRPRNFSMLGDFNGLHGEKKLPEINND